ncbi:hypothetical protein GCM10023231_22560 [Olivibacter ginsenosidimutans]|uniref:Uncharacterized protein n=1 Tax=Olivibacter ginsenosidimutans TaxID=1176537 RepID=A0ABP9BCN2_9SPHI
MANSKQATEYKLGEEILNMPTENARYGISSAEKEFINQLNNRNILSIKTMSDFTKSLLILHHIDTIEDLRRNSLDFLLHFDDGNTEKYFQAFFECKDFLKNATFKNRNVFDSL